jgi:VIT1/CCC1 family predicted Fe2+/Mn2+ transporter
MKIRGMSVFTQYHGEHKHTSFNSTSNLRAAIFGINDGLISNVSLILGIAGANANQHFITLAGIAGLLAGACSMGAGEYISVRSQREVFEYQIAIEKQELEEYPEEEMEELSLIYQARGVPTTEANKLAALMIANPETGLNTLAREELGLNPEDMVSPIGAMLSSFFSFAIGATIPLIPFFIGNSEWNLLVSIGITAITLFSIGAILSLFTNRNPIMLGLRMMSIGIIAGGITFMIGKWVGVAV